MNHWLWWPPDQSRSDVCISCLKFGSVSTVLYSCCSVCLLGWDKRREVLTGSQWPLALHLSASTRKSVSLASFNATISSIAKASLGISLGETSFGYNSLLSSEPRSPKNRKGLPVKTYSIILAPGIILICTVICCINCRAAGTIKFLATYRATVGQWTVIQQDGKTIHGYSWQQNYSYLFEMLLPCAYGSC